jgi:hypothetical protein
VISDVEGIVAEDIGETSAASENCVGTWVQYDLMSAVDQSKVRF